MNVLSPTAAERPDRRRSLLIVLVAFASVAILLVAAWLFGSARRDPYIQATLDLAGSKDHGGQLFRINCAGCHGIAAQGLLGPQLAGITKRTSDITLIRQIISGRTPPMPSFEIEPESMADLLAYLHSLT